jgi:hypothetical protein
MSQFTPAERDAGNRFALRVLARLEQAGLADPDPEDETHSPPTRKKRGR